MVVDGGVVDHVDDGHGEVDAHGVHVGEPEKPEEHNLGIICKSDRERDFYLKITTVSTFHSDTIGNSEKCHLKQYRI